MDWKDIAGKLARAGAPVIGGALGGPLGGMIGAAIGNVVADALGVESTPDAVDAAISKGDPQIVASQLSAAESEAQAKWPALAEIAKAEADDRSAQARAINQTMREELKQVSWFHWRHLLGYAVLYQVIMFTTLATYLLLRGEPMMVEKFIQLMTASVVPMGGVYALLGYVAKNTSDMKIAAVTGEKPEGAVKTIAKAIRK